MKSILILTLLFVLPQAHCAIQIESSRVIYLGSAKSSALKINNISLDNYIVQTWLEKGDSKNNKDLPMIVTPPLVKLRPEQSAILRFIYSGRGLPEDRESMFWINVQEVPPISPQENFLQLAIRTRLKLFYRPAGIQSDLAREAKTLSWNLKDGHLNFENKGPLHITLTSVLMRDKNGKTSSVKVPMISPFAKESVSVLPQTQLATMSYINDFGAVVLLYPESK